jgi:hypothetical protein
VNRIVSLPHDFGAALHTAIRRQAEDASIRAAVTANDRGEQEKVIADWLVRCDIAVRQLQAAQSAQQPLTRAAIGARQRLLTRIGLTRIGIIISSWFSEVFDRPGTHRERTRDGGGWVGLAPRYQ